MREYYDKAERQETQRERERVDEEGKLSNEILRNYDYHYMNSNMFILISNVS
jgi:hypothetical protein